MRDGEHINDGATATRLPADRRRHTSRKRTGDRPAAAIMLLAQAQLPHTPALAFGREDSDWLAEGLCGPGSTTNWLVPGRLLCGAMPENVDPDHWSLAAITHFVDLTDEREPVRFAAAAQARALAVGTAPPTFCRHTIKEFSTGGEAVVLAAVATIMQTLAADPAAVVYLHCRAGHGRTGMVGAIFIGLTFPSMSVDAVMAYIQAAHDDREDSWGKWQSPETKPQCVFARAMIEAVRPVIALRGQGANAGKADCDHQLQMICRWCDPALLGAGTGTGASISGPVALPDALSEADAADKIQPVQDFGAPESERAPEPKPEPELEPEPEPELEPEREWADGC